MAPIKRGKPTYNTLNARLLLERWIPVALRETEPEPEPEAETTAAGQCFRRVTAILEGKVQRPTAAEAAQGFYAALHALPVRLA